MLWPICCQTRSWGVTHSHAAHEQNPNGAALNDTLHAHLNHDAKRVPLQTFYGLVKLVGQLDRVDRFHHS
jgi:hypothetical protein